MGPEFMRTYTTKNTVISPNFLVWKFCGKAQFPHSFGRLSFDYFCSMYKEVLVNSEARNLLNNEGNRILCKQ